MPRKEGFGPRSDDRGREAVCPKEIPIRVIAGRCRHFMTATLHRKVGAEKARADDGGA